MAASQGPTYEYRRTISPAEPKATIVAGLLPPIIAFVLVSGATWSLLNGPTASSADLCTQTGCVSGARVGPEAAVRPEITPIATDAPLRVVVYDPALEPLKIEPWDAQTQSGPEAQVHDRTPSAERTPGIGRAS